MDPSKSSKLRKGMRGLMDKLSVSRPRSRSRSPSQSSHQPDPTTLASESTEGTSQTTSSKTSPSTCLPAPSPGMTNPSSNVGSELARTRLIVPTVVEPSIGDDAALSQPNVSHESTAPGIGVSRTLSGPSLAVLPKSERQTKSVAWTSLRSSLRLLHESSSVFPALSSAVGVILSCIDGLEAITKHQKDYEALAESLCTMSDSLSQYTSSMSISNSMSSIVISLKKEATAIQEKLSRMEAGGIREANTREEDIMMHYRRIQLLFQQLQTNVSMSTWSITHEQLAKSRLEGLSPAKQAEYDSEISTEVSRRGCTEGTRTTVLDGLHDWLHDSSAASTYWMNGMAGTGKTTIVYSFCEQVEARKQLAASFFCTRNSVDCRNTSRIIPTVAYQLARYSIPYQSALCEVLGQNPDIGSKTIRKQFEQLLRDPLQRVKTSMPDDLVVVIDALDECENRKGVEIILDVLFQYAGQVPLKFLITSRPEPEIYTKMRLHEKSRAVIHLHDIEQSLVRADIELYLKEELGLMLPTQTEIGQLSYRSGCLFIYAATLARYILYGKRVANPRQRLQSVLSLTPQSTKKHAEIDALYMAVLESALQEAQMEDHETDDINTILRTVLFAQEPVDVKTIAVLGGLNDPERVSYALQPLRSVIYQSEETGLVSTFHASFPDFLFSSDRSGVFFCDAVEYSHLLAQRCFMVMKIELRFNICALESSFVLDEAVDGLQTRVEENITPTLSYVCQYWASHLGMASKSGVLLWMLDEFLSDRLLFWMEVLSLRRVISSGISMLQKSSRWIKQVGSPVSSDSLIRLVDDSYTFVTNFSGSAASQATPHIYISCLPLCSRSNEVYKRYSKRMRGLLELKGTLIDYRDLAALASWNVGNFVPQEFSSDATQVIGGVDDALMILNVYNGAPVLGPLLGHTKPICACAFSLDGSRVVSASKDGTIRVWDSLNGAPISEPLKYDTSRIRSIARLQVGDAVVEPSFKPEVHYVISLALSPDGTRIVACFGSSSTIYLLDAMTGTLIATSDDHNHSINMVTMSPDGTMFGSASADVRLWDIRDGIQIAPPYKGHGPLGAKCVTFTPDSTRIVSGSATIQVWRKSDVSLVSSFGFDLDVVAMSVSPDGTQVASGSAMGQIRLWKIDDGTLLAGPYEAYSPSETRWMVKMLKHIPDGTRLVSHTSSTVAVWPAQQGVLAKDNPPKYPIGGLSSVVFSADGKHFVTRSLFGRKVIRKWDINDGSFTEISDEATPSPSANLSMNSHYLPSPNGLYAVTVVHDFHKGVGSKQVIRTSDNSIILGPWLVDIDSHAIVSQFSLDSTQVVIGFGDGTVNLWDIQRRELVVGPFSGISNERVYTVALSPDCSLIVSDARNSLRVINVHTPVLDIAVTANSKLISPSNPGRDPTFEGLMLQKDGWLVNSSSQLLFYVPLELRNAWPSPHTSLIVAQGGTVQVPKQTLFLGKVWDRCYIPESDDD